jgi:leucyl aminopeptidase (aminopeptidase T)
LKPEYATGARNAVRTCLGIGDGDRVAIIQDRGRADIAEAVAEEARVAGADVRAWVMEDIVERPATAFPDRLGEEILAFNPTASFYIGGSQPGELAFRQPLLGLLTEQLQCRHGHMVGIEPRLMTEGMAADYDEIFRVTRQVWEIARSAAEIHVTTRLGTDLRATFSPDRRWISSDGRYHEQGRWGNLPEGETFTAPLSVDGWLIGEEMGDHFAHKYGLFEEPARMRITGGRLTSVEMPGHAGLVAEIERYMGQHPNSSRVGEFAIGTNVGLKEIVGNFLQDEKFPGVHIAFGDPYGFETGADWTCPSHVDVLASAATVEVDGRRIMEDGKFLV